MLILFSVRILQAQDLDESNFIRYTRLQGLSNNFVSGIVQDSTGFIWIATHKGLNRFDGNTFKSIFKSSAGSPLPDNLLRFLHGQPGNEILGATRAGAFAYNPVTGQYRRFIIPCDSTIFFWTNNVFDIIKDHRQNYIVSTKTGLYVFNSSGELINRFDHHRPEDVGRVEMIFGGWLYTYPNGHTFQQNGLLGSLYDPNTNKIDSNYVNKAEYLKKHMTDSAGEMKMSCSGKNGELFILNTDINSIDFIDVPASRSISSPMPFSIKTELAWTSKLVYINDSTCIITCKNNGFYILNMHQQTGKLTSNGKKYFEKELCTAVFKDKEGRLWIGTADGLYKQNLHNSFFSVTDLSLQCARLVDQEIKSIYIENNLIYAGLKNEGGLLLIDKRMGLISKQLDFKPHEKFSNTISNVFPFNKDTLWIATARGILWLNKNNFHYGHLKTAPQLQWIGEINSRAFFEDSKNNIWISLTTLNSLIRYNRNTRSFTDIGAGNPLIKLTYVFSMAEDLQGNIWLAGDGLCRWSINKQMVDTLIPFPKVGKLLLNYMYILDRDSKNNLWLSSFDNEIIQFNCSTNTMQLRQAENNIVDGNTVTSSPIIKENIWMGTDNGISAFNIGDYSVKQFTYADGLPSVDITSTGRGSYYDRASDRFYIGAKHRLISFSPDISANHKSAPLLFLEKISTRDSVIAPAVEDIRLNYSQNNLAIVFNTINYTDPEEDRFAWRSFDHGDSTWNELNGQKSITLTNIPDGMNSVQIKLYSANNHWPEQIKTIGIHVQPPFWKTAWFISLMAGGMIGCLWLTYKRRVNAIRKKERENARVQQLIAEEYKNQFELEQISSYFSSCISGINNVDDVLWDVSKNLIGHMHYEDCIIYMWNKDKTKMKQRAAHGPKGNPKTIAAQCFDVKPGQGIVGHVIETKEPLLVSDTRKDKRYRVDDMNRLSELCVPIIHDDELIGVIDSEHSFENHFSERDVKILTTIATLVGNRVSQIESEQFLVKKQKELAYLNQQLAEAQLSALQTQMNPHFIFNSLNSIKGMILANEQQKASRYLSKFALMIRVTLNQSKEIFTSLYENLTHLENYLLMEKLRFDDSFSYQIVVEDSLDKEETMMPTLMIQPLAENAIWHGLLSKEGEKKLLISFYQKEEVIYCTIEDNGIGINQAEEFKKMHKASHQSVGLNNLRNRIKIMNEKYDIGCKLEIRDLSVPDQKRSGTSALLFFNVVNSKLIL
jgi:ligand-binding sensor domain-containing protein/putative methionine-R-sulfoxide reductase with GAF domain/two-component sensor histidine kinase